MKAKEAAEIIKGIEEVRGSLPEDGLLVEEALNMAIKALELFGISEQLPSAQPEPIKVSVDHAMTEEELKELKQKIADSPVVLLPPAPSDIIRCNACKHWTQTTGNMPGFGLGDCDYLNAKLVNCNGYCYWAERRQDG